MCVCVRRATSILFIDRYVVTDIPIRTTLLSNETTRVSRSRYPFRGLAFDAASRIFEQDSASINANLKSRKRARPRREFYARECTRHRRLTAINCRAIIARARVRSSRFRRTFKFAEKMRRVSTNEPTTKTSNASLRI